MSKQRSKLKFTETLERLSSKFKALQEQIVSVINSLIGVLGRAEQDIAGFEEQNQVHERLEKLHNSIAQLKPLSSISKINQDIYARVSKIGKELELAAQSADSQKPRSHNFEEDLIQLAILEHFLKENNREAANSLRVEHHLRDTFETGLSIYEKVRAGSYAEAITWAESERLYETFDLDLEFELRKREFLHFVDQGKLQEAIAYCKQTMTKFMEKRMKQIEELMGYLVFAQSTPSDRYNRLREVASDTEAMAKQFLQIYYEHNGISNFDSLDVCLRLGIRFEPHFRDHERLLSESSKKDVLPFSVDNRQHEYHSLFVCPVWKEVSSPHEKPIVLKCGHVIAEYSFNRIVDNRTKTKFKCPVCHAEQKTTDTVQMHF